MMECDEFNQKLVENKRVATFFFGILLILMIISQAIQIGMKIKIKRKKERKRTNTIWLKYSNDEQKDVIYMCTTELVDEAEF